MQRIWLKECLRHVERTFDRRWQRQRYRAGCDRVTARLTSRRKITLEQLQLGLGRVLHNLFHDTGHGFLVRRRRRCLAIERGNCAPVGLDLTWGDNIQPQQAHEQVPLDTHSYTVSIGYTTTLNTRHRIIGTATPDAPTLA